MQTFPAPTPPALVVKVPSAHLILTAARTEVISVDVAPAHEWRAADRRAAEQVSVAADGSAVTITGPERWFPGFGTARITVTVPEDTDVDTDTGNGSVRTTGRLGRARLRTSNGSLVVGSALSLFAETSNGALSVGTVIGEATLRTSSGAVRAEQLGTVTQVHTSNGALHIGEAGAELSATTSNGSIQLQSTSGHTSLRSTNGSVRVAAVLGGSLEATTSNGKVAVGVPEGVSVWVDAQARAGKVVNQLVPGEAPTSGRTAELQLSTSAGIILLYRPQRAAAA